MFSILLNDTVGRWHTFTIQTLWHSVRGHTNQEGLVQQNKEKLSGGIAAPKIHLCESHPCSTWKYIFPTGTVNVSWREILFLMLYATQILWMALSHSHTFEEQLNGRWDNITEGCGYSRHSFMRSHTPACRCRSDCPKSQTKHTLWISEHLQDVWNLLGL